jgi:hypothetical protein
MRLCAGYCDLIPSQVTIDLKQYIELAEIELREGLQTLTKQTTTPPGTEGVSSNSAGSQPVHVSHPSSGTDERTTSSVEFGSLDCGAEIQTDCTAETGELSELNFDSIAKLAEVPEAIDLEAILSGLKSCGESLTLSESERRSIGNKSGKGARDRLLGFDVCRMDLLPTETTSEQPALGNPAPPIADLSGQKPFLASDDATSLTIQYTEILESISETTAEISEFCRTSSVNNEPAPGGNHQTPDSTSESDVSHSDQEQFETEQADAEVESQLNISHSSSRESHSERSENSNPINSISPSNLPEINALKEELNNLLQKHKTSGSGSRSS